jgi:hypothetical protein
LPRPGQQQQHRAAACASGQLVIRINSCHQIRLSNSTIKNAPLIKEVRVIILHWKTRERQAALAMSEYFWLAQISRGKALLHFVSTCIHDSVLSKYAYHNTSASMWFVNFGSTSGFAISCVPILRESPVSCFFQRKAGQPPRRFGKQPQHLAGVEAAAECCASVQPVIRLKTKI